MRRVAAFSLVLFVLPVAGCIDRQELRDRWDDLEVPEKFGERTFLLEKRPFAVQGALDPGDLPQSPDEFGDRWVGFFTVPLGTRSMSVTYNVRFQNATPDGFPADLPKGSIEIDIESPGEADEDQHVVLSSSAGGGFDYRHPSPGEWQVRYNARGNGEVAFRATGLVPVNATAPAANASAEPSSRP